MANGKPIIYYKKEKIMDRSISSPVGNTTPTPPNVRFVDNATLPPSGRSVDTSFSNFRYGDGVEPAMRLANMIYKRRPPTPTRKRFDLGELDHSEGSANARSSRYNPEVEREEIALKDELLRIFNREKDAMEQHYLSKIQELLRSFKGKKEEWESMVKEEREDLESQFEAERSEMHQNFAQEIAKMARNFQDEKLELERKLDNKIKDREAEFDREKRDLNESWKGQIDNIKRQCVAEHEAMLNIELKNEVERHKTDLENLEKKFNNMRTELEQKHDRDKDRLEKRLDKDRTEIENKYQKTIFEMEKKHEDEKNRLQKKLEDEKANLERDWQRRLESTECALRKESAARIEVEKINATEKANFQALNSMLKEEIIRLKDEIDRLRKQPPPTPEIKIMERPYHQEQSVHSYNSRADLPLNLRDDFDRIVNEYKENLKDKFNRDKTAMEEKLENEREKLKQRIAKEKEELERRLSEEKTRMERDLDKSRDDIEKEIERRLRTKQLSESLVMQQQRFDEITRRIEEEEKKRLDKLIENDNKKYESIIQDLTRENEGLKAKVQVLEDNNNVLKNLKEEGQQEVERLRKAVEELKFVVESKHDYERPRDIPGNTDYGPFLMNMLQQQNNQQQNSQSDDKDQASSKAHIEALNSERKKLESLRNELQKQERDMRERRTVEDAAKIALDKSHEKYENLLNEKRKLEDSMKALESKVFNMQEDFLKLKYENQQQQPVQQPQTQHQVPQQMYPPHLPPQYPTQAQPIIVQQPMPPYPISPGKEKPDVNIITVPSPVPPQPTAPTSYPYYQPPPSGPTQQNISDQANKISKLKSRKEKLVNQVEELQNELREANYENSLLQKQCREYEQQISRLNDALEREKELSSELKNLAQDEKNYNSKLKDELEKENKKVRELTSDIEEMRRKMKLEIADLQTKLHHAGKKLTAYHQPEKEDIKPAKYQEEIIIPETVPLMTAMPTMGGMQSAVYASNAARRKMENIRTTESVLSGDNHSTILDKKGLLRSWDSKKESDKIKELEEDNLLLQKQLHEAKGALECYSGRLSSQLDNIESKLQHSTKIHGKDLTEDHKSSLGHFDTISLDPSTTARQNYILRQQKEHLQRLIERLTNIKPSNNPTLTHHVTNPIKVGSYNLRGSDYTSRLKDY